MNAQQRVRNLQCGECRAFTLIELLVVTAVVAILVSLVTPALQGLAGTSGRRGGLNTATAVLEHARLTAIETGATTYVGFPTNAVDPTNGFSHMIIFRGPRPYDTNSGFVAVTRWQRLPSGVFYEWDSDVSSNTLILQSLTNPRTLPRLGSEQLTNLPAIAFNRFGQLQNAARELKLRIGEKTVPGPGAVWRGGPSNFFELTIQPLTGRTKVRDLSLAPPVLP